MRFNDHSDLEGLHSFLSPSNYHWLSDDENHILDRFENQLAKERGTRLHAFAAEAIRLGIKMKSNGSTLSMYVNDAIGFKMIPEQVLYCSPLCFGTCDAISFRRNMLRIHDLKTGVRPASMKQLYIYEAIFCIEYSIDPETIDSELRIYQNNDVVSVKPKAEEILPIMQKIKLFTAKLVESFGSSDVELLTTTG